MTTTQKQTRTKNAAENVGKGTLTRCWWRYKLVHPLQTTVWRFPRDLKRDIPLPPNYLSPGNLPKANENFIFNSMFITVQLIIGNHPSYRPTNDWITKMQYICDKMHVNVDHWAYGNKLIPKWQMLCFLWYVIVNTEFQKPYRNDLYFLWFQCCF